MEQSEFTPPVRLSLTDQEISARLGAATADEAGMIAAMDFLEEQTNLRNQDNTATEAWISKMQESIDPRAKIALENLERVKQGLEPLPLVAPVPEFPVFNPSPEPVVEPLTFDEVIDAKPELPELVVAEEPELPELVVAEEPFVEVSAEPIGSAEEAAEVFEEEQEILAPKIRGARLVSAANWVIGLGVLAPAVAAGVAAVAGLNFVTSVLAGLVGVLVGVKVNVISLFTAKRTHRGLAVASRSSFGVFGAILPGLTVMLTGISVISVIAFASAKYFNNTIVGLGDFGDTVLALGEVNVSSGALFACGLVLVSSVLAIYGGAFSRWTRIVVGGLLLAAFVTYAAMSVPAIDYLNLAGVFQPELFLFVTPVFVVLVSVIAYGVDGESLAAASWGASNKTLAWPMLVFGFLLPLLTYGHFAALLNGHDFKDGLEVVQFVLSSGNQVTSTILVDFGILAVVGLLYVGIAKLIDALKTVGTNHIGYGLATLVSALVTATVMGLVSVVDGLALALSLSVLFLIPAAAWVGVQLTETVMRRGKFHDASLTRSYGFYGSFNWLALVGFVGSVTFALSVSQKTDELPWLGFLTPSVGWYVTPSVAALMAMGLEVLFTLATGYPNIIRQQRETKSVEDRRYDLVNVVVD